MRKRIVVPAFVSGRAEVGVVQAERSEDMLANVVIPSRPGHGGNDLARRHVEQIVICIVTAEARLRLHEAEPVDDLSSRIPGMRPEQEIAFAQAHAAAVGQKIADRHLMRNVGIVHDESRKTLVDEVVPRQLAFIH